MTKEDVLQVLRLTAMGRCGHPLQEEFAEKLSEAFSRTVTERPGLTTREPGEVTLPTVETGTQVSGTAPKKQRVIAKAG